MAEQAHKLKYADQLDHFRTLVQLRRRWWTVMLQHPPLVPAIVDFVRSSTEKDLPEADAYLDAVDVFRRGLVSARSSAVAALQASQPQLVDAILAVDLELRLANHVLEDLCGFAAGQPMKHLGRFLSSRKIYLRPDSAIMRETAAVVDEAARAYRRAFDRLFRANHKLIHRVVNREFEHMREDLASWAGIGLMQAIHRFDPDRGVQFSTYSIHWIRHAVVRARQNETRTVRMPTHMELMAHRVRRATIAFAAQHGRDPDPEETLAAVNGDGVQQPITAETLARLHHAPSFGRSIYVEDEFDHREEFLVDDIADFDKRLDEARIFNTVWFVLASCTQKERDAFNVVAGLSGRTLAAVGVDYGLSRERIRQIGIRVVERVRNELLSKKPRQLARPRSPAVLRICPPVVRTSTPAKPEAPAIAKPAARAPAIVKPAAPAIVKPAALVKPRAPTPPEDLHIVREKLAAAGRVEGPSYLRVDVSYECPLCGKTSRTQCWHRSDLSPKIPPRRCRRCTMLMVASTC